MVQKKMPGQTVGCDSLIWLSSLDLVLPTARAVPPFYVLYARCAAHDIESGCRPAPCVDETARRGEDGLEDNGKIVATQTTSWPSGIGPESPCRRPRAHCPGAHVLFLPQLPPQAHFRHSVSSLDGGLTSTRSKKSQRTECRLLRHSLVRTSHPVVRNQKGLVVGRRRLWR